MIKSSIVKYRIDIVSVINKKNTIAEWWANAWSTDSLAQSTMNELLSLLKWKQTDGNNTNNNINGDEEKGSKKPKTDGL